MCEKKLQGLLKSMSQPQIKSRRQHIRLWLEFYKLALDDPALQDNLAKVRNFYEPWGDPRSGGGRNQTSPLPPGHGLSP